MKTPKNPALRLLVYLLLIVVILTAFIGLWPIGTPYGIAKSTQALSNAKQLTYATLIYATDFDGCFPHGTTMATIRAQIYSTVQNKTQFEGVKDYSSEPMFNFNLAGVETVQQSDEIEVKRFSESNAQHDPNEVVLWYSYPTDPRARWTTCTPTLTCKKQKSDAPFDLELIFGPQFDRPGVTLAPANYLTDQDPLAK